MRAAVSMHESLSGKDCAGRRGSEGDLVEAVGQYSLFLHAPARCSRGGGGTTASWGKAR